MASLDIRPHSPRVSGWAIAGLMLLGAGAFGAGIVHQLNPTGPQPFPPAQQDNIRIAVAAPPLEVAQPEPAKPRAARVTASAEDTAPPLAIPVADARPAQAAPGADASATAPEPAAAAPAPPQAQTPSQAQPQAPADSDPPT